MKLLKYKIITGKIIVITGLRIGGSDESLKIGGIDNPVIKNPITDDPYIPGSSIKGKMRSILEWKEGKVTDGKVHVCIEKDCLICRIFGTGAEKGAKDKGPTRLIVRDAELTKESVKKNKDEGLPITEEKVENTINRINAKATPRKMERVLPGNEFDFEMIYKVYDMDDNGNKDMELFDKVLLGLKYLEEDTLGGAGSRGCGKIKFENITIKEKEHEENFRNIDEVLEKCLQKNLK